MEHSSKQEKTNSSFPIGSLLTRLGGVPADLVLDSVAQRPESPPFSAAINYGSIVGSAKASGLRKGCVKKGKKKFRIVTRGDRDFGY
jgi:hypothetical protein